MKNSIIISALILFCNSFYGTAQVIDSLDWAKPLSVSVDELMEGRLSGVEIRDVTGSKVGAIRTTVRGINSIYGSNQPVWIVDGAILGETDIISDNPFWQYEGKTWTGAQNSLLGFSVYDIKSIEVIKDISRTAAYGAIGANGVVLVTTGGLNSTGKAGVRVNADLNAISLKPTISASLSGSHNKNDYYISGNLKGLGGAGSYGNSGGFRFNFNSHPNGILGLGLVSSVSVSTFGDAIPKVDAGSDANDDSNEYRTTDSFWIDLALGKGLDLHADFGLDYRSKRRYIWYGPGTSFGEEQNGAASIVSYEQFRINSSVSAGYSRWFGKEHLAARTGLDLLSDDVGASTMNGTNFFDYGLKGKGINIAGSAPRLYRSDYNYLRYGAFAFFAYDHEGAFGADLSLRLDSNNAFAARTVYPAFNLFADLKESLFRSSGSISSMRLTAGWGMAGVDAYVPYLSFPAYSTKYPVSPDDDYQAFFAGRSLLKSHEWTIGAVLGLMDDRVRLELKYYDKVTEDSFGVWCNGYEFGENGYWKYGNRFLDFEQWGTVANKGIETDFSATLIKNTDYSLGIAANATYNINRIISVPYTDNSPDPFLGRWAYTNVAGFPSGVIVGYDSDNGVLIDHTGDGMITDADMIVLGDTQPKELFGVSLSASWKHLSAVLLVTGRFGGSRLDWTKILDSDAATGGLTKLTSDHVIDDNGIRPARISISYALPRIKFHISAAGRMAPEGSLPFNETGSLVAGICLTL